MENRIDTPERCLTRDPLLPLAASPPGSSSVLQSSALDRRSAIAVTGVAMLLLFACGDKSLGTLQRPDVSVSDTTSSSGSGPGPSGTWKPTAGNAGRADWVPRGEGGLGAGMGSAIVDGEGLQAGAGVVADSVPQSEQDECVNKAKALFRAAEEAVRFAGRAGKGQ